MHIIGQQNLLDKIDNLIENNNLPRFIIIEGEKNHGKSLIVRHIGDKIGKFIELDNKVSTVREMIELSYKVIDPVLYYIQNAENMHKNAENSLLKITEEPPRFAYFIITTSNINKILPTIRSRSIVLKTDAYTRDDLKEYIFKLSKNYTEADIITMLYFASSPGEINYISEIDFNTFWKELKHFLDNIFTLTGVECFKFSKHLKLKEKDEGYDPKYFLKGIMKYSILMLIDLSFKKSSECYGRDDKLYFAERYKKTVYLASKYINEFNIVTLNRLSTFDSFILELREIWKRQS